MRHILKHRLTGLIIGLYESYVESKSRVNTATIKRFAKPVHSPCLHNALSPRRLYRVRKYTIMCYNPHNGWCPVSPGRAAIPCARTLREYFMTLCVALLHFWQNFIRSRRTSCSAAANPHLSAARHHCQASFQAVLLLICERYLGRRVER
jgi:hypothetical protein